MNADIAQAKRRLPLRALMHQLGLGEHAKKSARCPFHDDRHNSFSVWQYETGTWLWKCHAGCGEGDEITFLEKCYGLSNKEATKQYLEMAGINSSAEKGRPASSEVDQRVVGAAQGERAACHPSGRSALKLSRTNILNGSRNGVAIQWSFVPVSKRMG